MTGSARSRSVLRYFLLLSQNTVTTTALGAELLLDAQGADEVGARRDADGQAVLRQQLRHQDGVAVVGLHDAVELVEVDDRRDELVRDALDAVVPDLVAGRQRRRLGGLERMHARPTACFDFRKRPTPMTVPPVPTPATNASGVRRCPCSCSQISGPVPVTCASTLASFENWCGRNVRGLAVLQASARAMLPRKPPSALLTSTTDAPKLEISAMRSLLIQSGMKIVTGWPSARPMAANEMPVLPLVASAIGSPGCDQPGLVGALQDVQRHAVLDAAGQVELLVLGVDRPRLAVDAQRERQQRRVADQPPQGVEVAGEVGGEGGGGHKLSP